MQVQLCRTEAVAVRTAAEKVVLHALMYIVYSLFLLIDVYESTRLCNDLTNVMDHLPNVTRTLVRRKREKLTKLFNCQRTLEYSTELKKLQDIFRRGALLDTVDCLVDQERDAGWGTL